MNPLQSRENMAEDQLADLGCPLVHIYLLQLASLACIVLRFNGCLRSFAYFLNTT